MKMNSKTQHWIIEIKAVEIVLAVKFEAEYPINRLVVNIAYHPFSCASWLSNNFFVNIISYCLFYYLILQFKGWYTCFWNSIIQNRN